MVFEDTFWPDCAEAVAELIDLVNHPRLGAVFDVGHANLKPMPIRDEIRLLGNRIKAIHVHDNNGKFDMHRAPFMGGSTSYDALISGLIEIGYEGYFTFEAVKMADLGASGHRLDEGEKLLRLPIDIRLELEKILYSMGKWMLSEYGVFEE
jgi:sugar phosphate isomerase/epimerase